MFVTDTDNVMEFFAFVVVLLIALILLTKVLCELLRLLVITKISSINRGSVTIIGLNGTSNKLSLITIAELNGTSNLLGLVTIK